MDTPTAPAVEHGQATPDSPNLTALHALLDAHTAAFAPEYDDGLADHGPMLLHALSVLGAGPERLQAFAGHYTRRLVPRGPAEPAPTGGLPWADLGAIGRFEAWRAALARSLAHDGAAATLRALLPRLMAGAAAGAFHGLIRTAHAWEGGHPGEQAAALAYWAAAWQPLRPADAPWPAATRDVADWLRALEDLAVPEPLAAPRIARRMAAVARSPGFDAVAGSLRVGPGTLPALARQAAALYADRGNFTVLHAVTACRAAAVLLDLLRPEERQAPLRHFAVALAAGLRASRWRAFGAPGVAARASDPWPGLKVAARAADDDHTAKLVHACWQLARRWPAADGREDPVWAAAAARGVGAVGVPPLRGVDHVHLDVRDRGAATAWYGRVLGLRPVPELAHWATGGGPLVLADAGGTVKLALFETRGGGPLATVALAVDAAAWAAWRAHLEAQPGLALRWADHGQAWSVYLRDPDGHTTELTCMDIAGLRAAGQILPA